MKTYSYRIEAPRRARAIAAVQRRGIGSRDGLHWLIAGVLAAALALATTSARSQTQQAAATAGPTASEYVQQSAQADLFEVNSSRLALKKSQDPALRDFAQQTMSDHSRSSDQLKQALKAGHVSANIPSTLDARHQQDLKSLDSKSGAQFDQAYLQDQMQGDRNALDLQRAYAQSGDNPALKQLAGQTAPLVQRHLAKLEVLAQQSFRRPHVPGSGNSGGLGSP